MRILQVIPTLEAGGAEGFVTNLGVGLAGLGAEVRFFLMAGVRGERGQVLLSRLREVGVEVLGAEEHNVRSPLNVLRLVAAIRTWRPRIVQANLHAAEVLASVARSLSIGSGACYIRRLTNTTLVGYRPTSLVRMMDRRFHMTIACSPAVAEAYRDFMEGEQQSELVTIPNGGLLQEAVTTTEEKRQARDALGIPGQAFVVAHIGSMFGGDRSDSCLADGQKAQDVLLASFARAFPDATDCLLVLVGDGPLRPEAEALARELGIAERTRFLGQQPEPWPALKAADVFCFPSRHEGLPNVLPEAASCGLPVVASDIPEIRYLYPSTAWLLKPVDDANAFADGLRSVRANQEVFMRHARDAAQGVREEFSMVTCSERYLRAYRSALTCSSTKGNASRRRS
jgi:glycosyltransferase involved in cell wall biosynthesis